MRLNLPSRGIRNLLKILASYSIESYIYKYHPVYGSPPVNVEPNKIRGVKLSADGLKARLIVDNLRKNYIHTIKLEGVRERDNYYSLVHPIAYYTLNNIPEGSKLSMSEVSTRNSATVVAATTPLSASKKSTGVSAKPAGQTPAKSPVFNDVKAMLTSYTCLSCHNPDKKLVDPSFTDIAKRKYSPDKIVQLIHNPQPQNWPEYPTPMPPMPQVKTEDALKIAAYINSLR
ncbi:MAG: c-type cytochrome [Daejeonella sp.]